MTTLLATRGLTAFYGDFQALYGVDFDIGAGETVALIGANGAGKSTFLRAVMGLIRVSPEMILLDGQTVGAQPPHRIVAGGVAIVPEGRRLFAGMTVEENLRVAIDNAMGRSGAWTLDRVFALFPILKEKRREYVQRLSGGQQQMVSIGRALLNQPRLLLCDEISLGLAPRVIREIYDIMPEISAAGTAVVLVEQDVSLAKEASDRLYCMLEGRITLTGASRDITRDAIAAAYFGGTDAVA